MPQEILALEDRIGNVSTGVTDDVANKHLKQARFSSKAGNTSFPEEEISKCTICQVFPYDCVPLDLLLSSIAYWKTIPDQYVIHLCRKNTKMGTKWVNLTVGITIMLIVSSNGLSKRIYAPFAKLA
jgi:hypothetical protein